MKMVVLFASGITGQKSYNKSEFGRTLQKFNLRSMLLSNEV